MHLNLNNKIAFITGASSGIGAAAAVLFAQEGADVVIGYCSDREGAEASGDQVKACGRKSWLCQMDLSRTASIQAGVKKLQDEVPHLDILVLCAGANVVTPLREVSPQEWHQIVEINLNGSFTLTQAVIPLLRPGGAIVTVASVAAHTGAPHHAHYAAAKAGLVNLTWSLARELGPEIRANCVAPGITLTPMGQETVAKLPADYAQNKLLLERYANPDEIARCIIFLASEAASFVTGATMDVNGGRHLR